MTDLVITLPAGRADSMAFRPRSSPIRRLLAIGRLMRRRRRFRDMPSMADARVLRDIGGPASPRYRWLAEFARTASTR
ncbi:MAG: hypothetical protein ABI414_06595 [Devosia sp.]